MGVWQEYGDIFYLIWVFRPLEDSSIEGLEAYFAAILEDAKFYQNEPVTDFIAKAGLKTGMSKFIRSVKENADTVQEKVETKVSKTVEVVKKHHQNVKEKASSLNPKVGIPFAEFDGWPSSQDLIYGFANGVVDVFPYESLPSRCRGNVTNTWQAVDNLFFADPKPYTWPENDVDYMYSI